ncbi:MAG TPA: glycosyltransferase family 4 protein [Candidatus Paceibacterota bacterium]|nr:glycosyltransferase family 4 protein [Verrucomicrobiota bacterium]HSA09778.1 glycosyltransferase family 4 protein [Candidatus Paceibacterota bacterium]
MKVLFNCHVPFMLAHGGAQVQIEQTKAGLERIGVETVFLEWWNDQQTGDILHHFARIPTNLLHLARQKGMKVVMSAFMSGLGARPAWQRLLQKIAYSVAKPLAPSRIRALFDWDCYKQLDAIMAMTPYEAALLTRIHNAPSSRVHVIPNGVEDVFLQSRPTARGKWLVCTASIIELKGVLKLARMAVQAETPVWIIGKPLSDTDDYVRRFIEYARQNQRLVRYEGAITDRERLAQIYREARGFVLLSRWESLSLSALEAAACQCPLLLSDLPWARDSFKEKANYCPLTESLPAAASRLRHFYEAAPVLEPPPKPFSWLEVGQQIRAIYESVLNPH